MKSALGAALVSALLAVAQPVVAAGFSDLAGWRDDDQAAALAAFVASCPALSEPAWAPACAAAPEAKDARVFFERYFRPVAVGPKPLLLTGYYEPEIRASPVPTPRFAYPIYAKPPELVPGRPWFDREAIESRGLLQGRGLELAWLADPVEVFFLQTQGSGRLVMPDGKVMRVGFAAKNGQPYRSIGREMVRRGLLDAASASAGAIKDWVQDHPEEGRALMWLNPSYVFFRKVQLAPGLGPLGALHLPLTPGRSLAVDPAYVPLGAPVWVETDGAEPLHRLTVAQDMGTAIKGPGRADLFIGSGARAGVVAGRMKDRGRMFVLEPVEMTLADADGQAEEAAR